MVLQGCSMTNGMSGHSRLSRSASRVVRLRLPSTARRIPDPRMTSQTLRTVSMSSSTGRPPTLTCRRGYPSARFSAARRAVSSGAPMLVE